MSEAANTYLTLFDGESLTPESDIFYIISGWFGIFTAYGFLDSRVPVDPSLPYVRQQACLNQVHIGSTVYPQEYPCGVVRPVGHGVSLEIAAEGPVITDNCPWHLSACQTVGLLDVPGAYRMVLNDPAAAGVVQIYLKAYPLSNLSRNSALFFGG